MHSVILAKGVCRFEFKVCVSFKGTFNLFSSLQHKASVFIQSKSHTCPSKAVLCVSHNLLYIAQSYLMFQMFKLIQSPSRKCYDATIYNTVYVIYAKLLKLNWKTEKSQKYFKTYCALIIGKTIQSYQWSVFLTDFAILHNIRRIYTVFQDTFKI